MVSRSLAPAGFPTALIVSPATSSPGRLQRALRVLWGTLFLARPAPAVTLWPGAAVASLPLHPDGSCPGCPPHLPPECSPLRHVRSWYRFPGPARPAQGHDVTAPAVEFAGAQGARRVNGAAGWRPPTSLQVRLPCGPGTAVRTPGGVCQEAHASPADTSRNLETAPNPPRGAGRPHTAATALRQNPEWKERTARTARLRQVGISGHTETRYAWPPDRLPMRVEGCDLRGPRSGSSGTSTKARKRGNAAAELSPRPAASLL